MGRPQKTGLDYFPLDVNFEDNVELLEAECGISGFGILIKLWQKIYSQGYYIKWEDDNALLFSRKINSDINAVNAVVNACLRRSIFNEKLYKKHKILTSKGIQGRYFKAITDSRRVNVLVIKDYYLLTPTETPVNTEFIELTHAESTQRKEEKIKEEKNTIYDDVVGYLNETINSSYKAKTKGTKKLIDARIKDRYELEDFKKVIDIKSKEWLNNDMAKFLRPETLFSNKFEGYLNQKESNGNGYDNQYQPEAPINPIACNDPTLEDIEQMKRERGII